jgi:large subunit ribosomal protein L35e
VRKAIAKHLTLLNEKHRDNVRELYKKKGKLPKDLRPRKTRALRR